MQSDEPSLSEDELIVIASVFITFRLKMALMRQLVPETKNDLSGLQPSSVVSEGCLSSLLVSSYVLAAVIFTFYQLSFWQRALSQNK